MPSSPASRLRRCLLAPLVCLLAVTLAPMHAAGQACEPEWLPGEGIPGLGSTMRAAVMWDPDGPGPAAKQLVLGGYFTTAGNITANRIVMWDPATGAWTTLGTGMADGHVYALAVLPDGDLVAAGTFSAAGDAEVNNIARWDGTAWHPLGTGVGPARAMLVLPGGDIIVGGDRYVTRWDGSGWNSLGSGIDDDVISLAALPNGDIVAGGEFEQAGGVWAARIARWDGTQWNPMSSGSQVPVLPLFVTSGGELIAGGRFEGALQRTLSRWDGSNWIRITTGYGVGRLLELPGGDWIAGGFFTALGGGVSVRNIARWDGENWHPLGAGVTGGHEDSVSALALLPTGDLFAGGGFDTAGAEAAFNAAIWDGDHWRPLSRGINATVRAVAQLPSGEILIGGDFTRAPDGAAANRVALWSRGMWNALGEGLDKPVDAIARLPSGDIIAGGGFNMAGSVSAKHIARWDGAEWHSLDADFEHCCWSTSVSALAVLPSGELVVGGSFQRAGGIEVGHIARWDGSEWHSFGSGMNDSVSSLLVLPNGDVIAGGAFTAAGGIAAGRIARWDGASWRPLGSGVGGLLSSMNVRALAVLPGGDLVAAGWFTHAGDALVYGIARWDGSEWSPLGTGFKGGASGVSGTTYGLAVLPNGDLIAGGAMWQAGEVSVESIARWDGSQWHAMEAGMNSSVWGLTVLPSGELLAVGGFTMAGDHVSAKLARWGCPDALCYADCDRSASLDFFDFLCFQNLFAAADPAADCDESGDLDFFDFLCFQNAFAAGCP